MSGPVLLVVMAIVVIIVLANAGGNGGYDAIVKNGAQARGILLSVAMRGTRSGTPTRRFQTRRVTIDVEIPGQPPYTIESSIIIPMNLVRDVLPGATIEIRVDRKAPNRIAVVGPGAGFSPTVLLTGGPS